MTYRVIFGGGAAAQFHQLPADAQDFLVARAVELAEEPWDATVLPPGDDPNLRETTFGNGLGLIGFHVNDVDEDTVDLQPRVDRLKAGSAGYATAYLLNDGHDERREPFVLRDWIWTT